MPVREKVKKTEKSRMWNEYNIDTKTSVDIQAIVNLGGRGLKINQGVFYKESLKRSPF